mmetsp:Transcript_38949/g.84983  ORF Transcript_38949/g.84983 Transcript_38949/m.84983 type:complete len:259 (+) Transcript_38949:902-1678(+)
MATVFEGVRGPWRGDCAGAESCAARGRQRSRAAGKDHRYCGISGERVPRDEAGGLAADTGWWSCVGSSLGGVQSCGAFSAEPQGMPCVGEDCGGSARKWGLAGVGSLCSGLRCRTSTTTTPRSFVAGQVRPQACPGAGLGKWRGRLVLGRAGDARHAERWQQPGQCPQHHALRQPPVAREDRGGDRCSYADATIPRQRGGGGVPRICGGRLGALESWRGFTGTPRYVPKMPSSRHRQHHGPSDGVPEHPGSTGHCASG